MCHLVTLPFDAVQAGCFDPLELFAAMPSLCKGLDGGTSMWLFSTRCKLSCRPCPSVCGIEGAGRLTEAGKGDWGKGEGSHVGSMLGSVCNTALMTDNSLRIQITQALIKCLRDLASCTTGTEACREDDPDR